MRRNQARTNRSVIFSTNLDFQRTFETLGKLAEDGLIDSLDMTRKGIMMFRVVGWDSSLVMISPKGRVTCYYHDDPPNAIDAAMTRGVGYVFPEWAVIERNKKTFKEILVPVQGEDLQLEIYGTSVPRKYFEEQRRRRLNAPSFIIFGLVTYVCDCGKEYKSRKWLDKHIEERCKLGRS